MLNGVRGLVLSLVLVFGCALGCSHNDAPLGGKHDAGCQVGSETCPCFGNDTCLDGLTCASNLCVRFGTGGTGGISAAGQAGATGIGGAAAAAGTTGSGGTTGIAGTTGGGGTTGTGGTTGIAGTTGSGGTTGIAGTTGTGGITGAGGATGTAGKPGSGGATGSGGAAGTTGGNILLLPDSTGKVTNTAAGISAAWYGATDSTPTTAGMGSCVRDQANTCSVFAASSPAQAHAFGPSDSPITVGNMCASGTVAQVFEDPGSPTSPDYSGIWGAYILLGFNGYGYGSTASASTAYNATAHGIVGISFQIATPLYTGTIPNFRVEFPTAGTPGTTDKDPAYWDGALSNSSPVTVGSNVILWSNVLGPMYETSSPPFDPTLLVGIQFHIISNPSSPTPFNFCISNLTALTSP